MKLIQLAFFAICMAFAGRNTFAQGFLKVQGQKIVTSNGENVLLRGIGLGGWMLQEGYMLRVYKEAQQHRIRERMATLIGNEKTQEFYNTWLANHTTKGDIDSLKAWGFNSVRLPMHFNLYTLPSDKEPVAGQQTWLQKGFELTDALLSWCKANNMYLILDLHAAPGGQGNDLNIADRDPSKPSLWDSPADQERTVALWKKLAEKYANEPMIAGYDILNEPNWGFEDITNDRNGLKETKNAPLKKLYKEITAAIREVDKNHIIIIEGNGWGNNYNGMFDDGLWDNNMVLSFHKYWNYNDLNSISNILKYRNNLNVPVWLGETGENSNVWFTQAIQLLEENNIGWAWWPLKKLGLNNPLQVQSNRVYDSLVKYWAGDKKDAPPAQDVYEAVMKLARATNIRNNIVHRDVVDAMIRQPHTTATIPFKENNVQSGTIIKAVDYDLGRNGYAYFDNDTANYRVSGKPGMGNKGNMYRNDGVDIFNIPQTNDYYVASIETGEWLQYTLDVKEAGSYTLLLTVAAEKPGSSLSVEVQDANSKPAISIPATGGGLQWKQIVIKNIVLKKGSQTIRIKARKGGYNLKELLFKK